MLRTPLAPVVREHGVWTYRAEPTDFFTVEALRRAWLATHLWLAVQS